MSKGTPSRSGGRKTHIICKRCGKHTYHPRKKQCATCGYGKSKRLRHYNWAE